MIDEADPGSQTSDPRRIGLEQRGSDASGLDALGLEASDDPAPFATTARQKVLGGALGLAGLAAVVALGAGAIAGVNALSWLWSYVLLSLGAS